MKYYLSVVLSIFTFCLSGQDSRYSFQNKQEFNEFTELIAMKRKLPEKFYSKINWGVFQNMDPKSDLQIRLDKVVQIADSKVLIYDLVQKGPLSRSFKQLVLYSNEGEFKDVLTLHNYSEDWSDGATHYVYDSYSFNHNQLLRSHTRRDHTIAPIENIPRGEVITTTFFHYTVTDSFLELTEFRSVQKTEEFYTSESLEALENMNVEQLRLTRNYFFAKYGYDFKDEELQRYFSENLFGYSPQNKNVLSQITENEKLIIEYILELENEMNK